ncbi:Hypothetical predicted protein [Olea europaea subsp. europaea]|uniref:Uncharacterized protein n=1 Tax=Olea europaea subsp. europaea TaxID=158383 RepID=A0A8S0RWH7_OLEEU|nr:Hypothetical predicted protein [Olea europaea subsp. europaea]
MEGGREGGFTGFEFFVNGIIRSRALPLPFRLPGCLTSIQVYCGDFKRRSEGLRGWWSEISTIVFIVDICSLFRQISNT